MEDQINAVEIRLRNELQALETEVRNGFEKLRQYVADLDKRSTLAEQTVADAHSDIPDES